MPQITDYNGWRAESRIPSSAVSHGEYHDDDGGDPDNCCPDATLSRARFIVPVGNLADFV